MDHTEIISRARRRNADGMMMPRCGIRIRSDRRRVFTFRPCQTMPPRTPRAKMPPRTPRAKKQPAASGASPSHDKNSASVAAAQLKLLLNGVTPAPAPAATATGATDNLNSWLSSNAAKAGGERFFLWYAVAWIALMAAIVATRAFESFTDEHYLAVGVAIFVPCILVPIVSPPRGEAHLPLWERYSFKNNVWVFIVAFYALWVWQIYFYKVLCTEYTFSRGYRVNDVPITLFLITQGYFSMYHAVSDAVLRAFWRRFPRASGGALAAFVVYLFGFCCVVAFAETFTIQNFEPYHIHDRAAMYVHGSAFYALYFVFFFPMRHRSARVLPIATRRCARRACICIGTVAQAPHASVYAQRRPEFEHAARSAARRLRDQRGLAGDRPGFVWHHVSRR